MRELYHGSRGAAGENSGLIPLFFGLALIVIYFITREVESTQVKKEE